MSTKTKILYVDDEKVNLKLFEINFKKQYEVLTAPDGFKGLEVLNENSDTKVIISDMKMPGMDGIEFITKAKEKHPTKKFYILTGFEITEPIKNALETGLIIEYFKKPFNIAKMHNKIAEAVNK